LLVLEKKKKSISELLNGKVDWHFCFRCWCQQASGSILTFKGKLQSIKVTTTCH